MTAIVQRIEQIISDRLLTKHPFYALWSKGMLSKETLQEYAKQYFLLEKSFPAYLENLRHLAPSKEAQEVIEDNLADERGNPKPHTELWLDFAEGLGLSQAQATSASPLLQTSAEISVFSDLTRGSYVEGLAGLLAYEAMLPPVSESKMDGLRKFYGLADDKTLGFFTVHSVADVKHSNAWKQLLAGAVHTKADEAKAVQAVNRAIDAMWGFLDGVLEHYVPEETRAMC